MNAEFPRTTYERAVREPGEGSHFPDCESARFILDEATALGIRVGASSDGNELIIAVPGRIPREIIRCFEARLHEYRTEVIEVILRGNVSSLRDMS
jgi:hypothetical protein